MVQQMRKVAFLLMVTTLSSHLLRQKRARSAVFHKVFLKDKKLSSTPLKTILNVHSYDTCCDKCLRHDECLSVNYRRAGDRECELLGEDRGTHGESSFTHEQHWDYYDTVRRDICNEKDSCYPCSCWTVEFYRSPCDCRKLMATVERHGRHGVMQIVYNLVALKIYGIGFNGRIYSLSLVSGADWQPAVSVGIISILKITENGIIYGAGAYNNNFYSWEGTKWNKKLTGVFSELYMNKQFMFVITKATGELQRTPINEVSLQKVTPRTLSRFQEHKDFWYGIDASCKCIMKHPNTPSPDTDKWEVLTTNPGSSVEFKIDFDDSIYSLHEDQNIYKWVDHDWVKVFEGPCASFDVVGKPFCLNTDGYIYTYKDFVPKPDVHISFKAANVTGGYTPYGRGADTTGTTTVQLDFEENNIALDQFGKGFVLWKGHGARVDIGNFEDTSLSTCELNEGRSYTISLWIRITSQTEANCQILNNAKSQGIQLMYILSAGNYYLKAIRRASSEMISYQSLIIREQLYQWTHVVMRFNCDSKGLFMAINGVLSGIKDKVNQPNTVSQILHVGCNGIFLSDVAIWYIPLHFLYEVPALYQSDLNAVGWNKKFKTVNERSCEELRRQRPFITSGYYWIVLNGQMVSAYCDMVTDGGGWTQVAHVDTELNEGITHFFYDDIKKIGDVYKKKFMLKTTAIASLNASMAFTQFRFRCTKSSHGRVVDIATTTKQSIDYMISASSEQPDACGAYYELNDDTSQISRRCNDFTGGKLFHHSNGISRVLVTMHVENLFSVSIKNRTCDDNSKSAGIWQFYVR